MKKYLNLVALILLTLVFVTVFPKNVLAKESLTISKWQVDAVLARNGDLNITEAITFVFDDDFNGVFREIITKKTDGIENIFIGEIKNGKFSEYQKVNKAKNGDRGVYVIDKTKDKIEIKIYSPADDEKKTFRLSYTVKNVAIKYNDSGELYYQFLGKENETPIDNFTIKITLPDTDNEDFTRVFAHGPLNGVINKLDAKTYEFSVTDIDKNVFIECRIVFPRDFINLSTNIKDYDNYDNILKEEAEYEKQLIEKAKRKEKIGNIISYITYVGAFIGLGALLFFLLIFKRKKIEIIEKSGIPDDPSPAVASYLVNWYINDKAIIATILDLFRKDYLKLTQKETELDEVYIMTKQREADEYLLSHECYFHALLFDKIGNGVEVSTKDLEVFSKEHNEDFINSFSAWKEKVKEDAHRKGYYDHSKKRYGTVFLFYSLLIFILSIITLAYAENSFGSITLVIAICMFIYGISLLLRKSDYGLEQYKKWLYFKKSMNKKKTDFSIAEYTEYEQDVSLIYELGLGLNKKVDLDTTDITLSSNSWIFWYILFMNNDRFSNTITTSFQGGSDSSISGGFTSGGGGGAGGGGAGGF